MSAINFSSYALLAFALGMVNIFCEGKCNTWNNVFANPSSGIIPLRHFGNKSYYMAVNHQANWFGAVDFCEKIKMKLLSIRCKEEDDEIAKYILEEKHGVEYWIGGTKLIDNVKWLWFPYADAFGYTNWGKNQPDLPNAEKCLQIWKENDKLVWNNRPCANTFPFICERYDSKSVCSY